MPDISRYRAKGVLNLILSALPKLNVGMDYMGLLQIFQIFLRKKPFPTIAAYGK
jgi:hypothetical protein